MKKLALAAIVGKAWLAPAETYKDIPTDPEGRCAPCGLHPSKAGENYKYARFLLHDAALARISHKPGRWSHIGRRSGGGSATDWRIGGAARISRRSGRRLGRSAGQRAGGDRSSALSADGGGSGARIDRARRSRGRKHCSGRSAAHQVGTSARHAAANAALSGQPPAMAT